ncbi:hypothetical protein MBLNU457_1962t1 [Dothideomycetes sp. NU457]
MIGSPKPSHSEDFYISLAGLPSDYDWKRLKDLAKNACKTVGWAEMRVCLGPYDGTAGDLKIKGRKEALTLYKYLTGVQLEKGRFLVVSLWDISPGHNAQRLATNDPTIRSDKAQMRSTVAQRTAQSSWQAPTPVQSYRSETSPQAIPKYVMHNGCKTLLLPDWQPPAAPVNRINTTDEVYVMRLSPELQNGQIGYHLSHSQSPMVQSPVTESYTQCSPHAQIPINASNGIVDTQHRTIFVSNLDWTMNESNIQYFLEKGGDLEKWNFVNVRSSQRRSSLLATYISKEEAVCAFRSLDQRMLGKNRVTARLARDAERANAYCNEEKTPPSKKERAVSGKKVASRSRADYAVKKSTEPCRQDGPVIANGSKK